MLDYGEGKYLGPLLIVLQWKWNDGEALDID